MALNSNERLQEAFSLALEDRSKGYQDLVSNANAILYLMKKGRLQILLRADDPRASSLQ